MHRCAALEDEHIASLQMHCARRCVCFNYCSASWCCMEMRVRLHITRATGQCVRPWTADNFPILHHNHSLQTAIVIYVLTQRSLVTAVAFHTHVLFLPAETFRIQIQQVRHEGLHKHLAAGNGLMLAHDRRRQCLTMSQRMHIASSCAHTPGLLLSIRIPIRRRSLWDPRPHAFRHLANVSQLFDALKLESL